jgi:hypothetical protein
MMLEHNGEEYWVHMEGTGRISLIFGNTLNFNMEGINFW